MFKTSFITNFDKEEIYDIDLDKYYLDDQEVYLEKSKLQCIHYRRNDAEIS